MSAADPSGAGWPSPATESDLRPGDPSLPVVSVAIAPLNAEDTLPAALDWLLRQDLQRVEILVADRGSTDGTRGIAADVAAADPRVRLLMTRSGTGGAALDAGAAAARGEYLIFVRDTDEIRPTALRRMVRTLRASGSDFVVGALDQVIGGRPQRSAITRPLHETSRSKVSLSELPDVLVDTDLTNTMFRASFWRDHVGGFRHDVERVETSAMVTAYLAAGTFDLMDITTCRSRPRADASSLIQGRVTTPLLRQAARTADAIWALLTAQPDRRFAEHWLAGFIDRELGVYVDHSVHVTAQEAAGYRSLLGDVAARFVGYALAGDGTAWAAVRSHRRMLAWLAAERRFDDVDQLVEWVRVEGELPPVTVRDGRLVADLPMLRPTGGSTDDAAGATGDHEQRWPDVVEELAPYQTAFSGCVEKAVWTRHGRLAVQGWAFVRGLDLQGSEPALRAWLTETGSGREAPVELQRADLQQANRWANQRFADVSPAGFRLLLDPDALPLTPDDDVRTTTWQLRVEITAVGTCVSGAVRAMVRTGVDQRLPPRPLNDPAAPVRLVPISEGATGFALQRRVVRAHARTLAVAGRTVTGVLANARPGPRALTGMRLLSGDTQVDAPLQPGPDGELGFRLEVPELRDVATGSDAVVPTTWSLRALDSQADPYYVSWPPESEVGLEIVGESEREGEGEKEGGVGPVRWTRSARAFCSLEADRRLLVVHEVVLGEGRLEDPGTQQVEVVVAARGLGRDEVAATVLRGPHSQVGATACDELGPGQRPAGVHDPCHRLRFALHAPRWGGADRPLSAGSYQLHVPHLDQAAVPADALLQRMPEEGRTEAHGWTVHRNPATGDLRLVLRAPLGDDERSAYDRTVVREWYEQLRPAPRPAVLFQCFRGEFATDSQRALHEELYRRGSRLELLWAVSDHSVDLPAGAVPVIINSREWYEATAACTYLCQNIDYDRWFRRRSHQRYLQTFHGYPFKSMGVSLWKAQGRSDRVVDGEVARRLQAWTSILLPDEQTVPMYRDAYRYDGELLVTGYPRDDSLLASDREAVRDRTRALLGLAPGQRAVLYAPTWRDTAATGAWTAELFDQLDLDRLITGLGGGYTVLLRGHNYVFRAQQASQRADVVDVTSYPEINDLILAADVAVLDYSSLRFDWMLTGKPAVFFVPDLDDYLSARTALFDYPPTAPGPLLSTTEEVLAALTDLDGVSEGYRAERERFNATYQPLNDGHAAARVVDAFFGPDATPS